MLTAARELQQVNNEIQSLENQAQMLINQARNLASLPFSALQQLEQSIAQTEQLLAQAQNIAYSVTAINQAFATTYPQSYPALDLGNAALQRRADPLAKCTQRLSAGHAGRRPHRAEPRHDPHSDRCADLVQPVGDRRIAGAQSGNQLTALQTRQLADLTAVIASIARAQSLDGARNVENDEQAQVQLSQFLSYAGYQPQPVEMFH